MIKWEIPHVPFKCLFKCQQAEKACQGQKGGLEYVWKFFLFLLQILDVIGYIFSKLSFEPQCLYVCLSACLSFQKNTYFVFICPSIITKLRFLNNLKCFYCTIKKSQKFGDLRDTLTVYTSTCPFFKTWIRNLLYEEDIYPPPFLAGSRISW